MSWWLPGQVKVGQTEEISANRRGHRLGVLDNPLAQRALLGLTGSDPMISPITHSARLGELVQSETKEQIHYQYISIPIDKCWQ